MAKTAKALAVVNEFVAGELQVPATEADGVAEAPAKNVTAKPKAPAFSIDKAAVSTGKVYFFKPSEVTEEAGFNVRDWTLPENIEHLALLKKDIKETGTILNPGVVRIEGNKIVVVSGHTRLKAGQELEKEGIDILFPATLETKGTSDIQRQGGLISHNIQKGFEVIELAALAYRFKHTYKLSDVKIAERLRVTAPYVGSLLMLNAAPEELRTMVSGGNVSGTVVIEMLRESKETKDSTPDYAAVTTKVAEALAEAQVNGRAIVTKKHLSGGSSGTSRAQKEANVAATLPRYLRVNVTEYLDFMCEVATSKDQTKGVQALATAAKKILKKADVNPVKYLKEKAEAQAE